MDKWQGRAGAVQLEVVSSGSLLLLPPPTTHHPFLTTFWKLAVWPRGAWRLEHRDGDSGNHLHFLISALRTGGQMGMRPVEASPPTAALLQISISDGQHAAPRPSRLVISCQAIDCPSTPAPEDRHFLMIARVPSPSSKKVIFAFPRESSQDRAYFFNFGKDAPGLDRKYGWKSSAPLREFCQLLPSVILRYSTAISLWERTPSVL